MLDGKPLKAKSAIANHLFQYNSQRSIQNISTAFTSSISHASRPMWLVRLDSVLSRTNQTALASGNIEAEQVVGHRVVET